MSRSVSNINKIQIQIQIQTPNQKLSSILLSPLMIGFKDDVVDFKHILRCD